MQNLDEKSDKETDDYVAGKVFTAQIDLLYNQFPIAVIGSLVVVSCIAFMLAGLVSNTILTVWYLAFLILTLIRGWLFWRYQHESDKNYQNWANAHIAGALAGGILVGIAPIIATHAPVEIHSFILFVIAGLCAGSLSTHASLVKVFLAFLIPATAVPGVWFLFQADQYHLVSGTVVLLFTLLMARSCQNYAATLENALRLQFSNEILNKRLTEARDAAEAANEAKSAFLSSMSHELRTPMNAILGFAQLIEDDEDSVLDAEHNEYLKQIRKAGLHLLSLINSVLDLAKLEADKMEVFSIHVSLGDVVNECVTIISPIAKQAGITINDKASSCDIEIHVDHLRMKQVILNLLSNGIKYNRDGGSVTLEVPEVRGGFCRLTISDTGVGLSSQQMDEIFLPFSRVAEHAVRVEGTGIGLNIICNLLELMGGRIGVESEEGVGSTFWVEVPLIEQSNK